jgi:hypothetical protein
MTTKDRVDSPVIRRIFEAYKMDEMVEFLCENEV